MDISNGLVLDVDFRGYSPRDKSVYGDILTNFGSIWTTNGRVFDGVDDYVKFTRSPIIPQNSSVAIEVWVYPTSIGSINYIFVKAYGSTFGSRAGSLRTVTGNKFSLVYATSATTTANLDTIKTFTNNKWYCVVGQQNNSNGSIEIYVNGVLENSTNIGIVATPTAGVSPAYLGSEQNTGSPTYFPGTIGIVRIWNRALMTMEINQLYLEFRKNLKI